MQFKPILQLTHVARRLDLDVQLNVLRQAGDGEIAGADQRDGADDGDARVRDVGFRVELLLVVGTAFDLAAWLSLFPPATPATRAPPPERNSFFPFPNWILRKR